MTYTSRSSETIALIRPRARHSWECLAAGYLASASYVVGYTPEQYRFFTGEFDDEEAIITGASDADVVAFTVTTFQAQQAHDLSQRIRAINPTARIVWGGYGVSGLTEAQLLEAYGDVVDHFVRGPGEEAWVDLLTGRDTARVLHRDLPEDLNAIPFPDRELIRVDRHFEKLERLGEGRKTSMEMQRGGCPRACVFCAGRALTRKRGRTRTAENIVAEMRLLRDQYGMGGQSMVLMTDAEVLMDGEMARVAALKQAEKIGFGFGMNVLADDIVRPGNQETLAALVDAGLKEVWMGVESGPSLMAKTGKGQTPDAVRRAFAFTRDLGLHRRAYFVLGFTPEETEATIRERIPFIEDLDPDQVSFTIYIPVPGAPGYDHELHRKIDYRRACEYDNHYTHTGTLTNEELRHWQQVLVNRFADRAAFRHKQALDAAPDEGGERV